MTTHRSSDQRLAAVRQVLDAAGRTLNALAQSAERIDGEIRTLREDSSTRRESESRGLGVFVSDGQRESTPGGRFAARAGLHR